MKKIDKLSWGGYKYEFQLANPLTSFMDKISYFKRREIFDRFMRHIKPTAEKKVIDIGVTPDVSLSSSNFFEKLYPWPENLTVASVEDAQNLEEVFKGVTFVQTVAGETFPFKDDEFDILFCSAVIEHVGDYDKQQLFLNECCRISKKVFLTTPNKWYPVDFHTYLPFAHWLPRTWHQKILRFLGMDFFSKTENLNLLSKKDILKLIPKNCGILSLDKIKLFFIPSNYLVIIQKD
jgi:hypothetical protein